MLFFLLGLALGVVIATVVEALLSRILIVVLAAVGIWLLNNDVGMNSLFPGDNTAATTANKEKGLTLENLQLSRAGYGLGGYALSGNVANNSDSWLATIYFQITLTDCRDSDCRIVGQENASASVAVPPKQMRAFNSLAIRFVDLPTQGSAKRSWSYSITGLRAGTDTDRQQQAKAADG